MAYGALENLQQTLDQILKHYDHFIITHSVKQEIVSIRLQAVVLQLNLKHFPDKERIRDVASTTDEIIEYLFSEENLSDIGESIEPAVKFTNKLRELAKTLESTAGDVVDYIKSKDCVSNLQPPTASQAVSSSSRPATSTSKDVVVGFDEDVKVIKDWLTEESSSQQVLPIVGTGGIGKTTLAKIIYNDALSMQYFGICGWVILSHDYSVANIALNLLASMKGISTERDVESKIPMESLIRKHLEYNRYLIVLDDVCSKKAWDDVKTLFPDNKKGSRIIVTTRLQDVAAYVTSSGSIHTMRLLDAQHSWNLLKQKVFADEEFPLEREDIGKRIVKNCGGLPLSIVLVAGLLSKIHTRDSWKQIAANGAQLETIICSSYAHLPDDSKPCFLYMAGFPEDYEIHVSELSNLWIAEGFLRRSNQSKSLEEEAEDCLEDLVDRSLVLVTSKKFDGKIKSCSLHDIVRDFCVRQARKEKVILPVMDYLPTPILQRHFLPRLIKDHPRISVTSYDLHLKNSTHSSHTRSIICIPKKGYRPVGCVEKFNSLRVLHVVRRSNHWDWEPGQVFDLIHLTYLASNIPNSIVPSTISKLQNLQTFIVYRSGVRLPVEIWSLRKLRHLIAFSFHPLPHPKEETVPLENLETLSRATDFMCSERIVKIIPNVKKLGICYSRKKFGAGYHLNNLKLLCQLEKLKLEMDRDFSFRQLDEMEMEMEMEMEREREREMVQMETDRRNLLGEREREREKEWERQRRERKMEKEMDRSLLFGRWERVREWKRERRERERERERERKREREMEMEMGMVRSHLFGRLDVLEERLNELESQMLVDFPSTPVDKFLEMDGHFPSRQLNEFEQDMPRVEMDGHFLSRQLHEFEQEMRIVERNRRFPYRQLDEFEQEMHGVFLSRELDEFSEMDGRFLYNRQSENLGLKMRGGFLLRLVDTILTYISFRRVDQSTRTFEDRITVDSNPRPLASGINHPTTSPTRNIPIKGLNHVFPLALKRLTLSGCKLPWSEMTVIGSLPNLQVLKLRDVACRGIRWKTIEGEFGELRHLLIEKSTLRYWRTQGSHVFPRLEFIMLHRCPLLSEIPSDIGDIPTLKLVEVDQGHTALLRSAKMIKEKRNSGNDGFQVRVKRS